MSYDVIIAGVGMIPFKKPGESDTYDIMGASAVKIALEDAGIRYDQIQKAYAGYVFGDSCSGQAALYHVGITGIPIVNLNNNCASGSTAFSLAAEAVNSGVVECALAVGFEQMAPGAIDVIFPDRPGPIQRHNTAAADLVGLSEEERKTPPALQMFGCQVELAKEQYGITDEMLAGITVKARRHAEHNEKAIFREPLTVEEILAAKPIFRGLRKLYACPPSCGAASIIVCTEAFAKRNNIRHDIRLIGAGWCSDKKEYFEGDPMDVIFRAVSREAARTAYEDAGVGPEDIDVIELHDCFTSNEIATYDALGLCEAGDMVKFLTEGQNTYGGKYVVCPSGGLIAKGHPLGATGLAQLTELTLQLRGETGVRQVEGARTALQHNGGLGSAGFVHILQRS